MEPTTQTNTIEFQFANGDNMPAFGLGTWKSKPGEVKAAVYQAIKAGYRHIDCAEIYDNQNEVGEGIRRAIDEGICKREDLWITSKLWNTDHKKDRVEPALKRINDQLGLDYLDLFLIHWPVALREGMMFPKEPYDLLSLKEVPLTDTWEGMAKCKDKGLAKHIGVSNFNQNHLAELLNHGPAPEMNQIELHPYLQQQELLNYCSQNDIFVTAYSPLGSTDRPKQMKKDDEPLLHENKTVKSIAEKHGVTPYLILIAWALNRGTAVIPKSTNPDHIKSNLKALDIKFDRDDLAELSQLDRGYRFVDGSFWAMEGSPYTLESLWG